MTFTICRGAVMARRYRSVRGRPQEQVRREDPHAGPRSGEPLTLVAKGKGILAADETVPTLTRRFDTLGIPSTEQSRRAYREMLFTSPGGPEFISGAII